jgi:hypothetical protein
MSRAGVSGSGIRIGILNVDSWDGKSGGRESNPRLQLGIPPQPCATARTDVAKCSTDNDIEREIDSRGAHTVGICGSREPDVTCYMLQSGATLLVPRTPYVDRDRKLPGRGCGRFLGLTFAATPRARRCSAKFRTSSRD